VRDLEKVIRRRCRRERVRIVRKLRAGGVDGVRLIGDSVREVDVFEARREVAKGRRDLLVARLEALEVIGRARVYRFLRRIDGDVLASRANRR
jgi:hypothetical protein